MKHNTNRSSSSELQPLPKSDAKDDLKSLPMSELQAKLGASPEGLSQAEAQKRLAQYGPNEIEEKKTNAFLKFLTYFWGPIPWMIEAKVMRLFIFNHSTRCISAPRPPSKTKTERRSKSQKVRRRLFWHYRPMPDK